MSWDPARGEGEAIFSPLIGTLGVFIWKGYHTWTIKKWWRFSFLKEEDSEPKEVLRIHMDLKLIPPPPVTSIPWKEA